MNKNKIKKIRGFTLVELIIVITILAILATIAFISFQGYTKNSRDVVRLETLKNIEKGLQLNNIKTQTYPTPDSYVTIMANGEVIGYQGDIGEGVGRVIGMQKGGKDPLDGSNYTYYLNNDKNSYELLGLGENNNILSLNGVLKNTYALDNSNRYPIVVGSELGILLDKNKVPVQQSGGTGNIDIVTSTGEYIGVKSNTKTITGTGIVLKDLNPNYLVKTLGGSGGELSNDIITDSYGNMYIAGRFTNDNINTNKVTDFNGNIILGKSSIPTPDAFIAKLDSKGNQQWVKTLGGKGANENSISITNDTYGNIYVTGIYNNDNINTNKVTDFNGNTLSGVSSTVSMDTFIAKLDNNGNQQWIKTLGGTGPDIPQGKISVNSNGLYIGGYFRNDNVGPNGSSLVKDFNGNSLLGVTSTNYDDSYVVKLDLNGNQQWIKTLGGIGGDCIIDTIVDNSGNIYVGGIVNNGGNNNIFDFKGNTLLTSGAFEAIVVKLDTNGNQQWIKLLGGSSHDYLANIFADNEGNIYVCGSYRNDNIGFNGSSSVKDFNGNSLLGLTSTNSDDGYVAKLNNSGNQQWIKTLGGINSDSVNKVFVDKSGYLYVGGNFNTSTFDFIGNNITGFGNNDMFLAKLDNNGIQQWFKKAGGIGIETVRGLSFDNNGNLVVVFNYNNNISNTNSAIDFKGYTILGESINSTINNTSLDIGIQKLFLKDLQ